MAIEIVSFPIKNGDFPVRYVKLPEGKLSRYFLSWPLLQSESATRSQNSWCISPMERGRGALKIRVGVGLDEGLNHTMTT